jgi:hypothetical protein
MRLKHYLTQYIDNIVDEKLTSQKECDKTGILKQET